jgi:putative transposase
MVRVPTRGTPTVDRLDFMSYDPEKHHRRSIRLKGFDYSRSATYFVTICVDNRECLFGTILQDGGCENTSDRMLLNDVGKMVSAEWLDLPSRFPSMILDDFVVMPNHFHGIICTSPDSQVNPTLGQIIGVFKSIVTHHYIIGVNTQNWKPFHKRLWQRNYYEHIIRDDAALQKIQQYIQNNPLTWQTDSLNPDVKSKFS